MKNWMETTDPKTSQIKYKTDWLKFRADRSLTSDRVWCFTDGSTTGWHSAVLVVPQQFYRAVARFAPYHSSRNIAAELNGFLLGLEIAPSNSLVSIVHDFIGVGAWTIGAWEINSEDVRSKIDQAHKIIKDKNLTIEFIHHAGHQDKKKKERPICHSDFTKWNCLADKMCENQTEHDSITDLSGDAGKLLH